MRPFLAIFLAAPLVVGSARGATVPHCAGVVEIDNGQLVRVEKNGVLVLSDGRAVHLEGIRLPAGALDHAPTEFVDQSLAAISAWGAGGRLTLTAVAPKEDRYDRIRAQVFSSVGWLQSELLKRGLARVSISPDRTECAAELYAIEETARRARVGLWSIDAYAVRSPDDLWRDIGTFQIVEGKVLQATVRNGRAYLNFGADWRRDFTVIIDPDDMPNFRRMGVDPLSYEGQTVRVRGFVQSLNGSEIEVANPQEIEVVQ